MKRTRFFIKIKDKMIVPDCFCPPHYLPHRFPIGEKIEDEPCHTHKSKWRMSHHIPFCKKLKCPNYKKMIEFNKDEKTN